MALLQSGNRSCSLPASGTELALEKEVEWDHAFGQLWPSLRFGRIEEKVARFRQVSMDHPNVHHDALEFPNGQIVLITRLCEGQRATVLQLPASPHAATEAQEQETPTGANASAGTSASSLTASSRHQT